MHGATLKKKLLHCSIQQIHVYLKTLTNVIQLEPTNSRFQSKQR